MAGKLAEQALTPGVAKYAVLPLFTGMLWQPTPQPAANPAAATVVVVVEPTVVVAPTCVVVVAAAVVEVVAPVVVARFVPWQPLHITTPLAACWSARSGLAGPENILFAWQVPQTLVSGLAGNGFVAVWQVEQAIKRSPACFWCSGADVPPVNQGAPPVV